MIWSVLSVWVSISGFITGDDIQPNSLIFGRICRDLANIWLDPLRSGQNLVESMKIWPRFHRITARSHHISKDLDQILTRSCRIWSVKLNKSPERLKLMGGSGFMGFERENSQPTRGGRVREFGTRVRPPELLDRVVAGQTRAGGLAAWTPLLITYTYSLYIY